MHIAQTDESLKHNIFSIWAQENPNELMYAEKVDRCSGGVKSKCALLKDAHKQAPAHIRWTKRQHSIAK